MPRCCLGSAPLAGELEEHVGTWRKQRIKGRERGRQVAGSLEKAEQYLQELIPTG